MMTLAGNKFELCLALVMAQGLHSAILLTQCMHTDIIIYKCDFYCGKYFFKSNVSRYLFVVRYAQINGWTKEERNPKQG